ncbi:hypothetical protein ACQEVF_50930 [Nonomuraea polychroma]|uniref:hypothetical protein n=1 Tax=Nonomuraea polychroma TaxID=46176 RepID=UPI003D8F7100
MGASNQAGAAQTLPLLDRVVALLILLYAQPVTRIVRLTIDEQEVCPCRGGVPGFQGFAREAQCSMRTLMRRLQFKVPGYEPVLLALTHG